MTLVHELAPPAQITESMALTTTGLLIGTSAGAAAAGWVVDAAGARSGYAIPALAAVLALGAASIGFGGRAVAAARSIRG